MMQIPRYLLGSLFLKNIHKTENPACARIRSQNRHSRHIAGIKDLPLFQDRYRVLVHLSLWKQIYFLVLMHSNRRGNHVDD